MPVFVSLFRAINVASNWVKMPDLKELHEALGFKNVTTLLQTGNVVFESEDTATSQFEAAIAKAFEEKFGFRSEVMVRTPAELKELVDGNPFLNQPEKETKWIVVMFLAASPNNQAKQELLKSYPGPEEIVFGKKEVYIYYPNGIGRSKLSNAFIEKKIKTAGTGRNWNTVTKLVELAQR